MGAWSMAVLLGQPFEYYYYYYYKMFVGHLNQDPVANLTDVCTTKCRLLTYLGHEFGELLSSFCVDKKIGAVFHRTKADMQILLSQSLYAFEKVQHTLKLHLHYKS